MDGKHLGAYPHVDHHGLQVLDCQRQFLSVHTQKLGHVTPIGVPCFSERVRAACTAVRNRMIGDGGSTPGVIAVYHVLGCGRTMLPTLIPAPARLWSLGCADCVAPPLTIQCARHSKTPSWSCAKSPVLRL